MSTVNDQRCMTGLETIRVLIPFSSMKVYSSSFCETKLGSITVSVDRAAFSGNSSVIFGLCRQGELGRKNRSCRTNKSRYTVCNKMFQIMAVFRHNKGTVCSCLQNFMAVHLHGETDSCFNLITCCE